MTRQSPGQISFDLGVAPARLGREDFLISDSNEHCLSMLDQWRLSGEKTLVICGPPSSGKTHLACILADALGAHVLMNASGAAAALEGGRAAVIDDAHLSEPADLLLLIDAALTARGRLVLVGRGAPKSWGRGLRDLETRLEAIPRLTTREPDEGLLQDLISKLLTDRQLRISAPISAYAAPRLPKTFAAASAFVAAIDRHAIDEGSAINLRLAKEVLDNLSEAPELHSPETTS